MIGIGPVAVETGLWHIQRYIMQHWGVDQSYQDIAPLAWYINTGRAATDFIRAVLTAKPFMVGCKLHEGGTYDEIIQRIKDYIGYKE